MPNNLRPRNNSTHESIRRKRRRYGLSPLLALLWPSRRGCARSRAGASRDGPLRPGRRSAQPQSALPQPRRRVGRAAARPLGFRAVHRPGRPRPSAARAAGGRSRRAPTAGSRPTAGRSATACAAACAGATASPVTAADVLFTLRAILDPRNPVRSHEGYDLIDRARARGCAHRRLPSQARVGAGGDDAISRTGFRRSSCCRRTFWRAQAPLARAAFNAAPTVGDGPVSFRFVAARRGAALRRQPALLARRAARSRADDSHDPGSVDESAAAAVGRAGLESHRAGAACGGARRSAHRDSSPCRPPSSRGSRSTRRTRRSTTFACGARIAMSIDRDAISRKITLGIYPVTNMIQPRFSWAFDPSVREPRYDPRGRRSAARRGGLAPRLRTALRRRDGRALRLVYVQFPETATGVRVAAAVQAALRNAASTSRSRPSATRSSFCRAPACSPRGTFDLAYVPWTMGADPDDSSVLECGAPSNYMRWCDPRWSGSSARRSRTVDASARKRLYARIGRIVAAQVPILFLFNADYVYAYRKRLHRLRSRTLFCRPGTPYQWKQFIGAASRSACGPAGEAKPANARSQMSAIPESGLVIEFFLQATALCRGAELRRAAGRTHHDSDPADLAVSANLAADGNGDVAVSGRDARRW